MAPQERANVAAQSHPFDRRDLVFNRPLSGMEKAAVMAYLAAKWDLE
ncbi:MAG: hypothetical protein NTY17_09710 [Planctomycetia bacterium]|nr:hypothetical protein [Planctomycetia bacterium]